MSTIIIGIHGLGNKPHKSTLESWWKTSMKEGLRAIKRKNSLPKFEMVYWADILYEKPLSKHVWNPQSPYYIEEKYTPAPKGFKVEDNSTRRKIIDFLGKQLNEIFLNEDFSLNYSFLTDFILRKYFKELEIYYKVDCEENATTECQAAYRIRTRLAEMLEKYKNDEIMLISHSMGSIIAYDVLTFHLPDIRLNTLVTMGSPLGLPVIISKIAAEYKRIHHHGEQRMITPPGIYNNWYNFSDLMDKIAFKYKLSDDFSANEYGVKPVDFEVVNDYHMNDIHNPHKSYGYLRTKEFSHVLFSFIRNKNVSVEVPVGDLQAFPEQPA